MSEEDKAVGITYNFDKRIELNTGSRFGLEEIVRDICREALKRDAYLVEQIEQLKKRVRELECKH
jgi:hypothetical protein